MASACTPRARVAEREAAEKAVLAEAIRKSAADRELRLAEAERKSLDNPDRPRVLHPETWPEEITVRIINYTKPVTIIAELGPDQADQASWEVESDEPDMAMAGAEVALAALGYTLDRFRMYQDMSLTVGHFYRKAGPYA